MNWRKFSKEKPENGQLVFVCEVHWKKKFPESCEIMGCQACYYSGFELGREWTFQTNDYSGKGSYMLMEEEVDFWIPAEEFRSVMPQIEWRDGFT